MRRSHVVTGGGRGVGRAVVDRLLADGGAVTVLERDAEATAWVDGHPATERLRVVTGDAADEATVAVAVERAESLGALRGWVNNAAIFRDAWLHEAGAGPVLELVAANLAPVVVGCTAAVRRFLAAGEGGAIVNVSSHQAQRPVPGCVPYATAKAAIEGLTRALAVDYGRHGIRVNTVALGSISTERYESYLADLGPAAAGVEQEMAVLHPLGRVGRADEVAAVVAHLLSDAAGFVSGATIPVDGGRSVRGADPEAHET